MKADRLDDALKQRFLSLKAEDSQTAPDFDEMYERALAEAELAGADQSAAGVPTVVPISRARRRARNFLWAAGTLAAAALAGILLIGQDAGDREFEALVTAFAAESAAWQSPTDDLLRVPGMDMLKSVPSVGWPYGQVPDGSDDRLDDTEVMG